MFKYIQWKLWHTQWFLAAFPLTYVMFRCKHGSFLQICHLGVWIKACLKYGVL